ncbi:MAG: DUF2059 domain-containing protein [Prolixibacteraceae bacterium]|nr:DUF2059 domain-containing protein [Prolixibacteraceae bacterium]
MRYVSISLLLGMLLAVLCVNAQSDYDKDLEKFLQINGSTETYNIMYEQILTQLKMSKPGVPDSVWSNLKTEVFDNEVKELTKKMVPLYKKHFTHEDVKELINFYESPIGKKLVTKTPLLTQESMQFSQQWGMSLMGKLNGWLSEKGY